jgi:outer membrane protein assembly factor BamB
VHGFDAKTGAVLWSQKMFKGDSYAVCADPIVKDDMIYVTAGYGGGCHCFEFKNGKVTDLYKRKTQLTMKNTHGGVVRLGDFLYGHSEGLGWVCQEMKTGDIKWEGGLNTLDCKSGAISAADGKLFMLTQEGVVALAPATPTEFKLTGEFNLPNVSAYPKNRPGNQNSKAWAHPAIAQGCLFLRDHEFVYCYEIKETK